MTDEEGDAAGLLQRYLASSRWENEAGTSPPAWRKEEGADVPVLSNTEMIQLRVRVIALENLVIALLAGASDGQREVAAAMATFISPRPGFTPHPMTLHAAGQMVSLVDRSRRFVCVGVITKAVKANDPHAQVRIDLPNHLVHVETTQGREEMARVLSEAGYAPV